MIFQEFNLSMVEPDFRSNLTDLIIELDHLKRKELGGSTHPKLFFQLKSIFHTLESIGSARIEGNNTTILEYIETKIDAPKRVLPGILEIENMENAMRFIDSIVKDFSINRAFICELHKKVVKGLLPPPRGEGDQNPGEYRKTKVRINLSSHIPPDSIKVNDYMEKFISFINKEMPAKYDLLKVAIAHHAFAWIHPFQNGNGRTVRLLTYAMLVKQGFRVDIGHIINPSAVFCVNRNDYYQHLSDADSGEKDKILSWCEYVLRGLKNEIEKIDRLLDYQYLSKEILIPAIHFSLQKKYIENLEAKILQLAIEKQVLKAGDIKKLFPNMYPVGISRQIRSLLQKKMLQQLNERGRKYILSFANNFLLRGIIYHLDQKGFLPIRD